MARATKTATTAAKRGPANAAAAAARGAKNVPAPAKLAKRRAPAHHSTGSHMKKAATKPAPHGHRAHAVHAAHETTTLQSLVAGLLAGRIRVIDLTQTLTPEFPTIALPPEFGQCAPFRMEEISRYDERGPAWYWNNFTCGEHTGTHFDAPIHWISGRDLPDNATDTVPVQQLVGAACVIDCTREAAADPDYLLTVEKLHSWEGEHGRIPPRSWVLMRTDWSKRAIDPVAYQNFDATGQHTPGPSTEAVRFLVEQRDAIGFGSEAIGTDAGQAYHLTPPYPCHSLMQGAGRYGLQCLQNLDLLPPTGTVIFAAPLKIRNGSGSPLRVLALVQR